MSMDSSQAANDPNQPRNTSVPQSDHHQVQDIEQVSMISYQNNETNHRETLPTATTHRVTNYRTLPQEKKLFVGGLPDGITNREFWTYFVRFGPITDSVVMHTKESNTPRGFGFVSFKYLSSVHAVLQNRFHNVKGKNVEVMKAVLEPMPNNHNQARTNRTSIMTYHQALVYGPGSYYYDPNAQYYYDPGASHSQLYSYGCPRYQINGNNYVPYYYYYYNGVYYQWF